MPTIVDTVSGAIERRRVHITAAEIIALGDTDVSGEITLGVTMPIGAKLTRARISNAGDAAATLATLTASLGDAADSDEMLVHATVFAAGAVNETAPVLPFAAQTAVYPFVVEIVGNADLATMTDLDGGLDVLLEWVEL